MQDLVFKSVREIAKSGLISEHYLRNMIKKGDCPCIKSGKKYLINEVALREKLDAMSRGARENTTRTDGKEQVDD